MDSVSLIAETFAPLGGKTLLDVGCGRGALIRTLASLGACTWGADPSEDAVATARENAPGALIHVANAENLPFEDESADGVIFVNSLHHIAGMHEALRQAERIMREDIGRTIIIEPLASGSFFSALKPLEDETDVRSKAQEAIQNALSTQLFRLVRIEEFNRRETFDDVDAFLKRVSATDPARELIIRDRRVFVQEAFNGVAAKDSAGRYVLDQPLRAHILATS